MQLAPGFEWLNGPLTHLFLLFIDVYNITYCRFEIEMATCADLEWAIDWICGEVCRSSFCGRVASNADG
jgi:hypothetical protein